MLGRLPAGTYQLALRGQQPSSDARVHAELIHRPRFGTEAVFATAEGVARQGITTGGLPGDMDIDLSSGAIESACGDKLVLTLSFVSGTSPYREVYVTLVTP